MLFESKSIVGIEITSSQIRFVRMDSSTKPAKVLDFGVVDLLSTHSDNIAQQLLSVVQKRGLEKQKASVAVSGPAIVHHTLTIPPMSKKDMRMVVEREVKKVIDSPLDEMVFDWKVSRDVEVAEGMKRELLVIIAPLYLISNQISLLKQSGLKPSVLTTIPLILLNSLNFTEERDKATAFIHLGKDEGYILFARKGLYYFSRDFPFEAENDDSKGLLEVQRSTLYFNQRFPGERIEMVILRDDAEYLSPTRKIQLNDWKEMLGVEVKVFDPVHNLDLAPLGGRAKEFCEIATRMAIPLGLARGLSKALPINLLSDYIKGEKTRFIEKRIALPLTAVFLLFAIGGYVGLLQRTNHYSQILREKEAAQQKLQPLLREIEFFQKQRDIYQKRSAFLQRVSGRNALLVKALQNLSLLVPEEVVFQSLKIERAEQKWQATIKGEATASDQVIALSAFNRLRSGLKASALFTNVESLPPEMGSRQTTGISSSDSGEGKTKIGFETKCEIRE